MNQSLPDKFSRFTGDTLWLIDASIYLYRAWHKLAPTNQVSGNTVLSDFLVKEIKQLAKNHQVQFLAVALDRPGGSEQRKALFPDYKKHRSTMPEALRAQFNDNEKQLRSMGIPVIAQSGFEADDCIATAAMAFRKKTSAPHRIIILSGDKDLAQILIRDDIWWDIGARPPLDSGGIKSKFGVWPQQIPDQIALAGDKADNIPGIPGVGASTAAKLLRHYHHIDQLWQERDSIKKRQIHGSVKIKDLLEAHWPQVQMAKRLAVLDTNVPNLSEDFTIVV